MTAILSPEGTLTKEYRYDSFGGVSSGGSGAFNNEVQFTGAIADGGGVYYMNARYYNSNTGRFLTQDTYKGNAWEPWTQHLYAYCGNNPVNMVDPTGHCPNPACTQYGTTNYNAQGVCMSCGYGAINPSDYADSGKAVNYVPGGGNTLNIVVNAGLDPSIGDSWKNIIVDAVNDFDGDVMYEGIPTHIKTYVNFIDNAGYETGTTSIYNVLFMVDYKKGTNCLYFSWGPTYMYEGVDIGESSAVCQQILGDATGILLRTDKNYFRGYTPAKNTLSHEIWHILGGQDLYLDLLTTLGTLPGIVEREGIDHNDLGWGGYRYPLRITDYNRFWIVKCAYENRYQNLSERPNPYYDFYR